MKKRLFLGFVLMLSFWKITKTEAHIMLTRHTTGHYYYVDKKRYEFYLYEDYESKMPVFPLSFATSMDEIGLEEIPKLSFTEEEIENIKHMIYFITEGKSFLDCGMNMLIGIQAMIWEIWTNKTGNKISYQFDLGYTKDFKKQIDEALKTYYEPIVYEYSTTVHTPCTVNFLPFLEEDYDISFEEKVNVLKTDHSFTMTPEVVGDFYFDIVSSYFDEEVQYYKALETEFIELKKGKKTPIKISLHSTSLEKKAYQIGTMLSKGVSLEIPKTSYEGETVFLNYQLDPNYEMDRIVVYSQLYGEIPVYDNSFVMPLDDVMILIEAHQREEKFYPISVLGDDGADVFVEKRFKAGEVVSFSVTLLDGYALQSSSVFKSNGDAIVVNGDTFVMPDCPVFIQVRTNKIVEPKKLGVKAILDDGVNVMVDSSYFPGDKVKYSLLLQEGYELLSVKVFTINNHILSSFNYEFIMPNEEVIIQVKTRFIEPKKPHQVHVVLDKGIAVSCPLLVYENERVTFSYELKDSYTVDSVFVKNAKGEDISVTDQSFLMPDEDTFLFITTSFVTPKKYPIVVLDEENSKISVWKEAMEGEKILKDELKHVGKIKTFSDRNIFWQQSSFVMPNEGVVLFLEAQDKDVFSYAVPNTYSGSNFLFLLCVLLFFWL